MQTITPVEREQQLEDRLHGQIEILPPATTNKFHYIIIGAGAIGSYVTLMLAKMGATKIDVFDNDTIEIHNIGNQVYPIETVGIPKVTALQGIIQEYTDVRIHAHNVLWTPEFNLTVPTVIISAVDNMDVRKQIWDTYKGDPLMAMFFDGRMGAQLMRIYAVRPHNVEEVKYYEKTLYSAAEAVAEPCTAKSIMFTVQIVCGMMLNNVCRSLLGQKRPVETVFDCINSIFIPTYRE